MIPFPVADAVEPNVTDWLQAVGTLAEALCTAGSLLAAGLLLWFEIRTRNGEQRDLEAAQARLVFAKATSAGGDKATGMTAVRLEVLNNSDATVFDLSVTISRRDDDPFEFLDLEATLDAGRRHQMELALPAPVAWDAEDDDPPVEVFECVVEFTDARGLRWKRVGTSQPERSLTANSARRRG